MSIRGSRHPVLTSAVVTAAFLLVVMAGNRLGGDRDDAAGMAIEGLTRVAVIVLSCLAAKVTGWADHGFAAPGGAREWAIFAPPAVYLSVLYPLFFTGSIGPNLKNPAITALVAAGSFAAGFAEDLVFRGLIFFTLLAAWGTSRRAVFRAAIVSAVFFSVPHILNLLAGHQALRVAAQILWAFLLGAAFALLVAFVRSVWPAAVLHGVIDAVVATNRMGIRIELSPAKAAMMVLASVPVLVYAVAITRRGAAPNSGPSG